MPVTIGTPTRRLSGAPLFGIMLLASAAVAHAQIDAFWTSPAGGIWADGANWSTDPAYPDDDGIDTYNAIIDLAGDPYAVHLNTDIGIQNLTLNSWAATLNHTAGTLSLAGAADLLAGTYHLAGGAIANGILNIAPDTFSIDNALLDGVTVNGDLYLTDFLDRLEIVNGLTLNGSLTMSGRRPRTVFDGGRSSTTRRCISQVRTGSLTPQGSRSPAVSPNR